MNTRENAGYTIFHSIRLDDRTELVIGHHPTAPAPLVVWDCYDGDKYSNGGYCSTYRQALLIVSERIRSRYDSLPMTARPF